jgi:hypothetical protein
MVLFQTAPTEIDGSLYNCIEVMYSGSEFIYLFIYLFIYKE